MPVTEQAGFPTYWTRYGEGGARPALLIHCSLAHSGSWAQMASELAPRLAMTAFDMPGHGRSAAWAEDGEIQQRTAEIAASFLDAPTDLIGHSFGATLALRLAVERPELVRSLTLIEPVFFAVAFADHPEMRAEEQARDAAFRDAMEAGDMRAAARAFTGNWGDGTAWETLPEAQKNHLASQMYLVAAGRAALYEDAGGMLAPGRLARVACPVLLIEGSTSPPIISAITEGLAARLPDARRRVIEGAGHMAPITHARQVAEEIRRFLDEA
ncbi:MAG: alpha/beta hydrolase [Roseovarius sp.]